MKIAIMQPYFMPYIGYFQLINAVDKFVIYDDVNFINKGWINRNNILENNKSFLFQIPLIAASQNKPINSINVVNDDKWKLKLLKTLTHNYRKAPYFEVIFEMMSSIINDSYSTISELNYISIKKIIDYLNIRTILIESSSKYKNNHLNGQSRILDICIQEQANTYINPIGGKNLYQSDDFNLKNINLYFLNSRVETYPQFGNTFIPFLSIIDCMMFCKPEYITTNLLNKYTLE